mmetsp:Transcript_37798/g.75743  ORF Transcript_37798/g.75743 Transcript_37798/m.75743 type:complete len:318 (-) Transcript_37798:890-1843(-)
MTVKTRHETLSPVRCFHSASGCGMHACTQFAQRTQAWVPSRTPSSHSSCPPLSAYSAMSQRSTRPDSPSKRRSRYWHTYAYAHGAWHKHMHASLALRFLHTRLLLLLRDASAHAHVVVPSDEAWVRGVARRAHEGAPRSMITALYLICSHLFRRVGFDGLEPRGLLFRCLLVSRLIVRNLLGRRFALIILLLSNGVVLLTSCDSLLHGLLQVINLLPHLLEVLNKRLEGTVRILEVAFFGFKVLFEDVLLLLELCLFVLLVLFLRLLLRRIKECLSLIFRRLRLVLGRLQLRLRYLRGLDICLHRRQLLLRLVHRLF